MDTAMMIRLFAGILFVVILLVVLPPYWVIFKKAGFSPWLSLLMFVPLANIIALYVVAFSKWKVVPVSSIVQQPAAPNL